MQLVSLVVAATVLSSGVAANQTWIVDKNNGPGTNFTSLPPAIVAAAPGDVLLVRPGRYSGFTLDKGLTIVADHGVSITSQTTIVNVPAGARAMLAGAPLNMTGGLVLQNCAGTVTLDGCTIVWGIGVYACADVRLHASKLIGLSGEMYPYYTGASIRGSRVEFASCDVRGGNGLSHYNGYTGFPGSPGIACDQGSRVHIALTNVTGGSGGAGCTGFCSGTGGDGAPAIALAGGSICILAGISTNLVRGGYAGPNYPHSANPGQGVLVQSGAHLRWSGVTVQSGNSNWPAIILNGGTSQVASPRDPTLAISGNAVAGGSMTLTLYGVLGTNGRLQLGSQPLVVDDGLATIERLDNRIRIDYLGPFPSNESIDHALVVPSNWQAGDFRLFQGLEIDSATAMLVERTNSVPVVVR